VEKKNSQKDRGEKKKWLENGSQPKEGGYDTKKGKKQKKNKRGRGGGSQNRARCGPRKRLKIKKRGSRGVPNKRQPKLKTKTPPAQKNLTRPGPQPGGEGSGKKSGVYLKRRLPIRCRIKNAGVSVRFAGRVPDQRAWLREAGNATGGSTNTKTREDKGG